VWIEVQGLTRKRPAARLKENNFFSNIGQRSCGCPLPGSVQGQAGWGFEQPGLVDGVHAHGRGGWN